MGACHSLGSAGAQIGALLSILVGKVAWKAPRTLSRTVTPTLVLIKPAWEDETGPELLRKGLSGQAPATDAPPRSSSLGLRRLH